MAKLLIQNWNFKKKISQIEENNLFTIKDRRNNQIKLISDQLVKDNMGNLKTFSTTIVG